MERGPDEPPERTDLQQRITRLLSLAGLAIAVAVPFGLLVIGIESGSVGISAFGLVLAVVVAQLVSSR
ncbi:MAG: ABC-type uncharacterized transport system permease subunit [Natronomonas sp.]|jgi:ABC-type uncharacterized transport system permease subunit|uniref:hypothetical protein n=1 Tax=Natronomonas sp. TaxID=2184060 RepID=UPI003988B173